MALTTRIILGFQFSIILRFQFRIAKYVIDFKFRMRIPISQAHVNQKSYKCFIFFFIFRFCEFNCTFRAVCWLCSMELYAHEAFVELVTKKKYFGAQFKLG